MKRLILGIAALILVGGVIFIKPASEENGSKETSAKATQQQPNSVWIQDFAFGSNKMTVKKGTKITWTNMDDAHHDITPLTGANDFVASKLLSKGEAYEFTFNTAGTYTYKCSPHPYMKGTIEVTE